MSVSVCVCVCGGGGGVNGWGGGEGRVGVKGGGYPSQFSSSKHNDNTFIHSLFYSY